MICKYCHSNTHIIDVCPTIICKKCKNVGHPQWLCKDKKIDKKINNLEKKYLFNDELKKPINELKIQKNINFYLKILNKEWGELCDR